MMIEPLHKHIRISRQCDLIGLPRASYYYASKGDNPKRILECYPIKNHFIIFREIFARIKVK